MRKQALEGLKVVGFVTAGVGPLMLRSLVAYGAAAIHVESSRNPDITRSTSPFKDRTPGIDRSYLWAHTNPDNYSFVIDMKHPRAKEVANKLVGWADVVVDNYRPGVMENWGLSYEELKVLKPEIIVLRSSQQGLDGPYSRISAAGPHLAGLAGFVGLTGQPDRPPVSVGAYPDFVAPSFGIVALLAALDYKNKTGKGQLIDVSQYETSVIFLASAILDYTVNNRIQNRNGNRDPQAVPHGVYRCKGEDKWCAIAVFKEPQWEALCRVIDHPEFIKDSRFMSLYARKKNEDELDRFIEMWTIDRTPDEVMFTMQQAGIEAGSVRNFGDVAGNCPQTKHRRYLTSLEHPVVGDTLLAGSNYILSKTPGGFRRPAPCFGEHNYYVCTELLGISDSEFVKLVEDGVFQ